MGSGTPWRIGLATLLAVALSVLLRASCSPHWWGPAAPHPYCYSDLAALFERATFKRDALPYVEAPNEYPVLTALFAYGGALASDSPLGFFLVNTAGLAVLAVATALVLEKAVGSRAILFALAPTLVLYAVLNWDLLAVALTTSATWAFLSRRHHLAGVLLGLGAAAKLYPALLVVPFSADLVSHGLRRRAAGLAGAAALAWLAVNLPFAVVAPSGWSLFLRFAADRPATLGTLWSVSCRIPVHAAWCQDVNVLNTVSVIAYVGIAGASWWLAARWAPAFPRWALGLPFLVALLLTSKVYSPQYSLWLIPWFALVLPDLRLFAAFEVADVMVYLMEFSAGGAQFGLQLFPRWTLGWAVSFRAVVLAWIILAFIRDARAGVLGDRAAVIRERLRDVRTGSVSTEVPKTRFDDHEEHADSDP
ncbi:MAG TPA: glycosyltransferase 87 family protein [Actinomycetota bacterium]|nr:glycosyltransferase 87 family protein [Actinomycetota bacterium]